MFTKCSERSKYQSQKSKTRPGLLIPILGWILILPNYNTGSEDEHWGYSIWSSGFASQLGGSEQNSVGQGSFTYYFSLNNIFFSEPSESSHN